MTESEFKNKVQKYLKDIGAWYIKYWAGSKFTKEGVPDILACINGQFYGIELKAENGKPTLLQLKKLKDIQNAGGIGILLYPNNYKHFIALVEKRELGIYWYKENKQLQQMLFNELKVR